MPLTLKQTEDIYQTLTLQLLGLDPVAPANQRRVRMSWPTGGAPAWAVDENVAFLSVNFDNDPITNQIEITYQPSIGDQVKKTSSYTLVHRISWIFYGPSSYEDADMIRSGLYGSNDYLIKNNLALITDVPVPVRSPELFNGQWWERTSFYARFNEGVVRSTDLPYLQTIGDLKIVKG